MISFQNFFFLSYILWVKPHYLKKNPQLSQKSGSVIVIEFALMIKTGRRRSFIQKMVIGSALSVGTAEPKDE